MSTNPSYVFCPKYSNLISLVEKLVIKTFCCTNVGLIGSPKCYIV